MASKQHSNGLLLKLVGAGIVYQIMHQAYLWYTLQHEFDGLSLEDECTIDSSGKPLCLEAQLFRSWERVSEVAAETSHAPVEFQARADSTTSLPTSSNVTDPAVTAAKSVAAKAAQDARRELEELFDGVLSALNSSDSMESMAGGLKNLQSTLQSRLEVMPEAHKKLAEDTVAELDTQLNAMPSHASFDELYAEVSKEISKRSAETPWAKDLADVQEKLKAASHNLRQKEKKIDAPSPWVQSLLDMQKSLETRKAELDRLHPHAHHSHEVKSWDDFDREYEELMSSLNKESTTISPFAQNLIDTQAQMQKMSDELAKKHKEHASERDVELRKLSGNGGSRGSASKLRGVDAMKEFVAHSHEDARTQHEAWELEFAEKVNSVAKDLCADDAHRNSPACAAFQGSNTKSTSEAGESSAMTHEEWMANIANEADSYHRELCADPVRKGTGPCLAYEAKLAENAKAPTTQNSVIAVHDKVVDAKTGLRGRTTTPSTMSWRAIKSWKASKDPHTSERMLTTVTRAEVRHAHWGGMIPKVGLISVVPSGRQAKFQMKYFMDNFLLQNYEGAKQLILVYHQGDREAQELAKEYADGTYIKAVASRGDGTFPSASDYRFGAYSSDAEIIARWDFNEFHMPHQVSTQVRAMALSQRPASVLMQPGAEFGREESIIGEAAWMREHWLPLSETERDVLQHSRAHQIVQVDQIGHAK